MKNGDESLISGKMRENICSICKSDKIPINIINIKENNLKKVISNIKKSEMNILIQKCNCRNNKQYTHKLCLLLNIIFNFELKCNECKANYNIHISISNNNYKKCLKICSFIFLTLFHIILYGASVFLFLYISVLNKGLENNFEDNKLYHIYYFFGSTIFLINTFLIFITYSTFIDKNSKDIYNYKIDIKDINENNKKNQNTDKYYNLLYKYYRFFYNTQIRYLICKKQETMYISKGYGYFNKDLQEFIFKSNKELNEEINAYNKKSKDILNINKKLIEQEKEKSKSSNNSNNRYNNNNYNNNEY